MKLTDKEFFYTSEGLVDSKHILNTNPDKEIDISYLDLLEKEGVTLEQLKEFENEGLDIFRYKTQITIHGIFPTLKSKRIGDYKSLIENKNRSIGVKWRAIDLDKKKEVFTLFQRYYKGFSIVSSSQHFFLRKYDFVKDKEDFEKKYTELKEIACKIDKKLFYGNVSIFTAKYIGQLLLVMDIHLNAIDKNNIPKFITKATGVKYQDILNEIKLENEAKDKETLRIEKQKEANKEAKEKYIQENIIPKGFILEKNHKVLKPGDIIFALSTYIKPDYTISKFSENYYLVISDNNKLKYITIQDENDTDPEIQRTRPINDLNGRNFYYKPKIRVEMKVNDKPNIRIVDYSEKAVAIYGDTKPYKGELKSMGGSYNSRLKEGPGWIFKASKKEELKKFFNL